MKLEKQKCCHSNATFYAVQKLGTMPGIVLYNCPDCKTTLSEQHLFQLRSMQESTAKLAVA